MKQVLAFFVLCLVLQQTHAQTVISAADAVKHLQEKATVCDKVYGGRWLDNANEQPTLINMGAAYPASPFTFVILGENRKKFSYKPEEFLVDKQVCVTGEIIDYKGKPEIIVTDSIQVHIK
jgi:micrococcal nuclease